MIELRFLHHWTHLNKQNMLMGWKVNIQPVWKAIRRTWLSKLFSEVGICFIFVLDDAFKVSRWNSSNFPSYFLQLLTSCINSQIVSTNIVCWFRVVQKS